MSEFKVSFWDVGQGDCSVIELPDGQMILIDVGSGASPISGWLRNKDVLAIVLTHNDADHAGALSACITSARSVKSIFALHDRDSKSKDFKNIFSTAFERHKAGKLSLKLARAGDVVWHGVVAGEAFRLEVRHPDFVQSATASSPNEKSLILSLSRNGRDEFIWAGDAPMRAVADVSGNAGFFMLAGPHHGAPIDRRDKDFETSLRQVKPKNNLLSYSRSNRYCHPYRSFVEKQAARGVEIYCTGLCGDCGERTLISPEALGHVKPRGKEHVSCRGGLEYTFRNGAWEIDDCEGVYQELKAKLGNRICGRALKA